MSSIPQRDTLYIFEKNLSCETACLVSDGSCKSVLKTSTEKVSYFWSNCFVAIVEHLRSNPLRNNFVEGKIWDHIESKMTQKQPKLEGGVILWSK